MSKNIYIPEDRTVWCLMRLLIGLAVENYHHLHILSFFSENIFTLFRYKFQKSFILCSAYQKL